MTELSFGFQDRATQVMQGITDLNRYCIAAVPALQAMRDAAAALQRARPSAAVYDRRRKVEWALRLQQRWLRWVVCSDTGYHWTSSVFQPYSRPGFLAAFHRPFCALAAHLPAGGRSQRLTT